MYSKDQLFVWGEGTSFTLRRLLMRKEKKRKEKERR
jgi:hypothetical protein